MSNDRGPCGCLIYAVLFVAWTLDVAQAGVDIDKVAVVHEDGEGHDLLHHVGDHGGGGHQIDLVFGYLCKSPVGRRP